MMFDENFVPISSQFQINKQAQYHPEHIRAVGFENNIAGVAYIDTWVKDDSYTKPYYSYFEVMFGCFYFIKSF